MNWVIRLIMAGIVIFVGFTMIASLLCKYHGWCF